MAQSNAKKTTRLSKTSPREVETLYAKMASDLHRKIDETRDAYFGFIFPITRDDLTAVTRALNIPEDTAQTIFDQGRAFSTFRTRATSARSLTNHIFGASILALRGKQLDSGLSSVTDKNAAELIHKNQETILEIAEVRSSWFGRIFFPAVAFSNAIRVFGGNVGEELLHDLATEYGYAGKAGERLTIRGDFGIGVWLTLLAVAP
jgi:hypothetical protein